jgi:alcohol dehydrogenase
MASILQINFPNQFIFGNGSSLDLIKELIKLKSKKVFIVTIGSILESLNQFFKDCNLNHIQVQYDISIINEPTFNDLNNVLKIATSFNPDTVIGIGGGSVLDIAKLLSAQISNTQTLDDIVGIGLLKQRSKKLICLPTTSGTGSEMSPNAILVSNVDGQKKGIISPYLVPDVVIVDPLLTIQLPSSITAATGIDALTHCLEAYTNVNAHPIIDDWAIKGVALIANNIVEAVNNGTNTIARENVALGSVYGGMCLGPVNTAAIHALSYPLGSKYHLSHGLSNALLLPYVYEFNLSSNIKKHAALSIALGSVVEKSELDTALKGIETIKQLLKDCHLPLHLNEVGVQEKDIEQMAIDAMKIQRLLKNNPREVTLHDAIQIYKNAF